MKISSVKKVSFRRAILPASIIAAMALSGSASAFKIDSDNPDIDMRFDNTFRYNAAWRMQDPKADLLSSNTIGATEHKFDSGDMVTNRLDILHEFDFIYKKDSGFRVSAATWYDQRMQNDNLANTLAPGQTMYFSGNAYPDEIKRYYGGPSSEWLDAFVFTKIDLGDVPVNMKLGQHTIYWGETLFSLADGVSAGQANADLRKGLATPGLEAKEFFKPLNQFSFSAQISPELTVMGQYYFDNRPDLFPLGGTFYSPVDFLTYAGNTNVAPGLMNWDGVHYNGLDKSGDWGLAAKWRPEWLDGTAGIYFREYTPKNAGSFVVNTSGSIIGNGGFFLGGGSFAEAEAGIWYDPDMARTKLIGFSLAKQMWGISFGTDLTYRKDANLFVAPYTIIGGPSHPFSNPTGPANGVTGWAPTGDIYTAVVNMIAYDGKRGIGDFSLYDSAVLTAELNWDGLDKVNNNPQNFNGHANCIGGTSDLNAVAHTPNQGDYGCSTSSSVGLSFLFEPKWFQVFPGTDMTMPIFFTQGLHGNSAVPAVGSNEGMGAWSVGVTADVDAQYNFALKYNGFLYKRRPANPSVGSTAPISNAALGDFSDRNTLSFTAKATW